MTLTEMVANKLNQWEKESAIHFCCIMQRGGTYEQVQYPTGLLMFKACIGTETAEIHMKTAKQIKKSNWTICC